MFINERPEGNRNPDFDNDASLREADSRLGLKKVMEQYGDAPQNGHWKSFTCPFCKKKAKSAHLVTVNGVDLFKCFSTSCMTGAKAMAAVQYIALKEGLSNKDAFTVYLKQAGVWKERTKLKGQTEISNKKPERQPGELPDVEPAPPPPAEAEAAEDEQLILECIEVIRTEQKASVSLLQRRLRLGYGRAARIMDELERRGIVGPSKGAEPREIFPAPEKQSGGKPPGEDPSAAPPSADAPPGVPANPPSAPPAPNADPAGASTAEPACSKLPGAEAPTVPVSPPPAKPLPPHEADGRRSLEEFYSRLSLSDSDGGLLLGKRGLFYVTSAALRFRSNPKSNRDILVELEKKFGLPEMLASGLWVPRDKKRNKPARPNAQFCGAGIIGRLKDGEEPRKGQWKDQDGNLWGWVNPVLIPYFDEEGKLVGLRPHKGMGRSGTLVGTPQIYVPRGMGGALDGAEESFSVVVITEGEFKAAAIWQVLGAGRSDGVPPVGVAALPGISMGKNYEIREVLEDWLYRVKCQEVIVVFDNEEKSDPSLGAFKSDYRKRHDSQIWARYLATDLYQKLHIKGYVGNLPVEWRNDKGKADWDGAAAEILRGKRLKLAA